MLVISFVDFFKRIYKYGVILKDRVDRSTSHRVGQSVQKLGVSQELSIDRALNSIS